MLLLKIPIKHSNWVRKRYSYVEQIYMISVTKLSKGRVAILLIIVISPKKDRSGKI